MEIKKGTKLFELSDVLSGEASVRRREEFAKRFEQFKLDTIEEQDRRDALWEGVFEELKAAGEVPKKAKYKDYVVSFNEEMTTAQAEKKTCDCDTWDGLDGALDGLKQLLTGGGKPRRRGQVYDA